MANSKWYIGILSSPAPGGQQVPEANNEFSDISFVGVIDGSPDGPWNDMVESSRWLPATSSPRNQNIAAGYYPVGFSGVSTGGGQRMMRLRGNGGRGCVKIDGLGENYFASYIREDQFLENLHIINYVLGFFNDAGSNNAFPIVRNCIIEIPWDARPSASNERGCLFEKNIWLGAHLYRNTSNGDIIDHIKNTFIGRTVDFSISLLGSDNHFKDCSIVDTTAGLGILNMSNCAFENCTFTVNSIVYNTLDDLLVAHPGAFPNSLEIIDSELVGDPVNKGEFSLQPTSPLIGSGANNSTIGAIDVGELTDLTGAAVNNLTIASDISFSGSETVGDALPLWKQYPYVRKCPKLEINGFIDGEIVPDAFENSMRPEWFICSVNYRETIGGADQNGLFIYGLHMFKDDSGRTTGENDFNPYDISSEANLLDPTKWDNLGLNNIVNVAEIQPFIEVVKKNRSALRFDNNNDVALHSLLSAANYPLMLTYCVSAKFYEEITDSVANPATKGHQLIYSFLNAGFQNQMFINMQRVNANTVTIGLAGSFGSLSVNVNYNIGDKIFACVNLNRGTGSVQVIVNTPTGQIFGTTSVAASGIATFDRIRMGRDGSGGIDISAQMVIDEAVGISRGSFLSQAECNEIYADGRMSRWIEKNIDLSTEVIFNYKARGIGPLIADEAPDNYDLGITNMVSTTREKY